MSKNVDIIKDIRGVESLITHAFDAIQNIQEVSKFVESFCFCNFHHLERIYLDLKAPKGRDIHNN